MATATLADQKRDALARQLAASAHIWPTVTLTQPFGAFEAGTVFWGIPSSTPGVAYLANEKVCKCPDYMKMENICKHIRAVRLAAEQAQAPKPRTRYEDLFPDDLEDSF